MPQILLVKVDIIPAEPRDCISLSRLASTSRPVDSRIFSGDDMRSSVDLSDPHLWTSTDVHTTVSELRRSTPVYWHESVRDGPLWSVLSYGAAVAVLGNPEIFSSQKGSLLGTGSEQDTVGGGEMMALCDPPRHRELRDPVTPLFTGKHVSSLKERIGDLTAEVVGQAVEKQEVDFVHDVGATVPTTVMCDLMGVPEPDRETVVSLCDQAFLGRTPATRRSAHQRLLPYLFQLAMDRRRAPGNDIVSALAGKRADGRLPPLEEVALNCDNIIVGGVQTVRHSAAMSVLALIEHPDAWRSLRKGSVNLDTAVEELLRWTSVGLHVLRTARRDVVLDGCEIAAGDRVVVWTPATNRDDAVFRDPQRLDLSRHPNRHIAFGWGPHYCIGAALARLELRALFAELVRRVDTIEPLGDPTPNLSIINFGLDRFPVRIRPR